MHAIIAFQRNEQHWLINDDDAKRYGTALGNALRHLPIKTAQKTIDYSALVFVAFAIETPRVVKSAQLARQRHEPPRRGPAQVFQFHPPSQPTSPATPPPPSPGNAAGGSSGPPPDFAEGPPDPHGGFGGDAAD